MTDPSKARILVATPFAKDQGIVAVARAGKEKSSFSRPPCGGRG